MKAAAKINRLVGKQKSLNAKTISIVIVKDSNRQGTLLISPVFWIVGVSKRSSEL